MMFSKHALCQGRLEVHDDARDVVDAPPRHALPHLPRRLGNLPGGVLGILGLPVLVADLDGVLVADGVPHTVGRSDDDPVALGADLPSNKLGVYGDAVLLSVGIPKRPRHREARELLPRGVDAAHSLTADLAARRLNPPPLRSDRGRLVQRHRLRSEHPLLLEPEHHARVPEPCDEEEVALVHHARHRRPRVLHSGVPKLVQEGLVGRAVGVRDAVEELPLPALGDGVGEVAGHVLLAPLGDPAAVLAVPVKDAEGAHAIVHVGLDEGAVLVLLVGALGAPGPLLLEHSEGAPPLLPRGLVCDLNGRILPSEGELADGGELPGLAVVKGELAHALGENVALVLVEVGRPCSLLRRGLHPVRNRLLEPVEEAHLDRHGGATRHSGGAELGLHCGGNAARKSVGACQQAERQGRNA
mmetsp:Transcript_14804/g.37055  ORF Transcript_14804/g.37055 Transcript_14804/m.37055 type:complete len:414 (+) Transcript_14804:173-1414(+)